MEYCKAFLCGGMLCLIGQILIDKTPLTPAKILVSYVTAGVILSAVGLYQPLVDWGGAGATVPLTGFGHLLAKGVRKAVAEEGVLGALTGGTTAAAGGIAAAIFFGFLVAPVAASCHRRSHGKYQTGHRQRRCHGYSLTPIGLYSIAQKQYEYSCQ